MAGSSNVISFSRAKAQRDGASAAAQSPVSEVSRAQDTLKPLLDKVQEAMRAQRYADAFELAKPLLEHHEHDARLHFTLGQIHFHLNRNEPARIHYHRAQALNPKEALVYLHLGNVYQRMRELDKAAEYYGRAIEMAPQNANPYISQIFVLDRLNRTEEMFALLEKALPLAPKDPMLLYMAGRAARRKKDYANAAAYVQQALANKPPAAYEHMMHAELSKIAETVGDYAASWQHNATAQTQAAATEASRRIRTGLTHQILDDSTVVFTREQSRLWRNETFDDGINPVFLVGFPRSGTTLMEQILGAHPRVVTTDERVVLGQMAQRIGALTHKKMTYPHGLETLTHEDLLSLRRWYQGEMQRQVPEVTGDKRLVDKNPMNIFLLGLANRVFPQSKVLVMIRDPRDVCLSCYFQTFAPNADTVHFYTLEDTARYYAKVMGLWLQDRQRLSLDYMEVKYEDMVRHFEPYARAIVDYIGEEWDDAVLAYHQAKQRAISTPSHEGINQPVYDRSIGKWRHYEAEFAKVQPILAPYLKAFGYE